MTTDNSVASNNTNKRKVLQIRKGEYLLDIMLEGGIRTTYNEQHAMDIGKWDFNQFSYIVTNLKKVGYKQAVAKWIDVVEEVVEEVETDEV